MSERGSFVFGRHPVAEAVESGQPIDRIYLQQGTRGEFEKEVRQLCRVNDIPLQYVPKEKLNRLVQGNHQGIVGFISIISYQSLENVVPGIYENGESPLILIVDQVTDVRNFGAIARSAEICGVHAIVVPKTGSALINADAIKASAGALTRLSVCRENSLINTLTYLENSGIRVLASDLQANKAIWEIDLTNPVAIVIGSEDQGVQPAILSRVKEKFIIPQKGETDSFNVSVAAGIILYESLRQRGIAR
jgi:23S rRNA (guanosine2251-2'-O)-methyltransferase